MAPSAIEREMRLLRAYKEPCRLEETEIKELGITVTSYHDEVNDALILDFGLNEPAFDLPEDDGRMIWKIGRATGSVTGFILLGVSKFEIDAVEIKIFAKKKIIEEQIKLMPNVISAGRPTRVLIESVEVASRERPVPQEDSDKYDFIFAKALEKVKQRNGQASG